MIYPPSSSLSPPPYDYDLLTDFPNTNATVQDQAKRNLSPTDSKRPTKLPRMSAEAPQAPQLFTGVLPTLKNKLWKKIITLSLVQTAFNRSDKINALRQERLLELRQVNKQFRLVAEKMIRNHPDSALWENLLAGKLEDVYRRVFDESGAIWKKAEMLSTLCDSFVEGSAQVTGANHLLKQEIERLATSLLNELALPMAIMQRIPNLCTSSDSIEYNGNVPDIANLVLEFTDDYINLLEKVFTTVDQANSQLLDTTPLDERITPTCEKFVFFGFLRKLELDYWSIKNCRFESYKTIGSCKSTHFLSCSMNCPYGNPDDDMSEIIKEIKKAADVLKDTVIEFPKSLTFVDEVGLDIDPKLANKILEHLLYPLPQTEVSGLLVFLSKYESPRAKIAISLEPDAKGVDTLVISSSDPLLDAALKEMLRIYKQAPWLVFSTSPIEQS